MHAAMIDAVCGSGLAASGYAKATVCIPIIMPSGVGVSFPFFDAVCARVRTLGLQFVCLLAQPV